MPLPERQGREIVLAARLDVCGRCAVATHGANVTLKLDKDVRTDNDTKPLHKPRVVWTEELHQRFLRAIDAAGSDEAAVPTAILRVRASLPPG